MEKKINIAFINLLSYLISANSVYFIPTLQLLVKSLGNLSTFSQESKSRESSETLAKEARILIHQALRGALVLVPTGVIEVMPVLASNFPFRRHSVEILAGYVEELLRICEYIPVLQSKIIELIIDKCLEIDVEIVIEDSGEVMIKTTHDGDGDVYIDGDVAEVFQFEDQVSMNAEAATDCSNLDMYRETSQHIAAIVSDTAEKLDTLLMLLVRTLYIY
jgi:hypothetical protein